MKKIINGKVYDTSTATSMADYSNGGSWSDFQHYEETLYRKKTGEFFLFGEGGPMTQYAKSCGQNQWTSGKMIIPLTYASAQKWAEEHLDGDDYEAIFGEVVEDDSKVVVTYRLSSSAVETVKRRAAESGIGISEYLESLIK